MFAALECRPVMQDIVAQNALARRKLDGARQRLRLDQGEQMLRRRAGRLVAPFDISFPRRIAHCERARIVEKKHRPHIDRTNPSGLIDRLGNGHGFRMHQQLQVPRIGVAQPQIGQFMIEQAVFPALLRRLGAMKDHRPHATRRSVVIVIAVGVPRDPTVGIGNIAGASASLRDLDAHDSVAVGRAMILHGAQAERLRERQQPGVQCVLIGRRARATRKAPYWSPRSAPATTGARRPKPRANRRSASARSRSSASSRASFALRQRRHRLLVVECEIPPGSSPDPSRRQRRHMTLFYYVFLSRCGKFCISSASIYSHIRIFCYHRKIK